MRKLWPPTYDDCSVRLWAIVGSLALNLLFFWLAWLAPESEGLFYFFVPGIMFAMMSGPLVVIAGNESAMVVIGAVIGVAANLGFYYLISWALINMFRPATNWWPEKHS